MIHKNNYFKVFYFIIIIITVFFVSINETSIKPDSEGYLNASIIRSFGYPFFIKIHSFLFASSYLTVIKYSQLFLILGSSLLFIKTIQKYIITNKIYLFLLFITLLLPIFFETKIANSVLSEGISYSLYLLFLSFFFTIIFSKEVKVKHYILGSLILFLLINSRGQFLFLIPLLLIVLVLKHYKTRLQLKKLLTLFVLIITIPILSVLSDKFYHKVVHNHFVSTPWTGIQLAALPMFISQQNDSILFNNEVEKKYFLHIYKKLEEEKLLLSQLKEEDYDFAFYYENYTTICNKTLSNYGELFFVNEPLTIKVIKNDKITAKVALVLFKKHYIKWTVFVFKNLYNGFYSISNLLLLVFLILISFFNYLKTKKKLFLILLIFGLLIFFNLLLISIVEPIIGRYIFYNNWVLFVIIAYLLEKSTLNLKIWK